jgi:2,3-dihydroxybenzoate-AMP ligase
VVLRPGTQLDLEDLRAVLLDKGIAKFKLPEQLEIRAAIPLTPVGKPDKKRLLETLVRPASPEATRKA